MDHAGEHGAINIYLAQRAACHWRALSLVPELDEFLSHERRYRALFASELARRSHRRCRSYHLFAIGGATLGLVTGLIGPRAVHATTAAIEQVVLDHLQEQCATLAASDPEAVDVISEIIADEQAHHDAASSQLGGRRSALDRVIYKVVEISTEAVIWLGMKL